MVILRSDAQAPPRPVTGPVPARRSPGGVAPGGGVRAPVDKRAAIGSAIVDLLGAGREPREVLGALGEIVVPALGTWLAVGLADPRSAPGFGITAKGGLSSRPLCVELFHAHPEHSAAVRRTTLPELPSDPGDFLGAAPGQRSGAGRPRGRCCDLSRIRFTLALDQGGGDLVRLAATTAHVVTVPLVVEDRLLGLMTLGAPRGPHPEREVLAGIARHAAAALERCPVDTCRLCRE